MCQSSCVLILLPPSEGKAAPPRRGRPVDPGRLSVPALTPVREKILDALSDLCADPDPARARAVLGLGPTQDDDVRRNAALRTTPTLAAADLYTGVLYDALGLATLDASARRLANRSVLVFSGLWGVLKLTDRVPPYRCAVGTTLPGVGGLAAFWRPALTEALAPSGLVLDLRSGAYAAMWQPPSARSVAVRVLQDRDGRRTVVSHFNKATKGRMVRDLLSAGANPRTPSALVGVLGDLGYTVEQPAPGRLDVVVTSL
jgi:cytoplasmic iron level regulating protein YaaA (DUF328/UPF0246 family)